MTKIIIDFEKLEKKDYDIDYDDSIRIIGINFHYPFDIISILLRNDDKSIEKRAKIKNNFFILDIENTILKKYDGLINLLFLDINEFISIQYHPMQSNVKINSSSRMMTLATAPVPGIADDEKTPFEYCIIDGETRQIKIPILEQLLGVEGDNKAERKYFKCPRYVGNNIDLTTLNLRVNWRNAQGDLGTYLVEKVITKDDMIEFYWVLDSKVTAYIGSVDFIICAIKATPEGIIENKWNTTVAKGNVIIGLPVESPTITESEQDVIAQLLGLLDQKSLEAIENIKIESNKQIEKIQNTTLSDQQTQQAINKYLEQNPIKPGASQEEKNQINQNKESISKKLDKNQGAQHNGKILGIDSQGNIIPIIKPLDGTSDYTILTNKPQINGHELNGNQTAEQLGLQHKGDYLTQHQDISGKADKTEIPTKLSQLQNDSQYQSSSQVQNAINQAIKGVTQFEYEKVSILPQVGVKGKIYLIANSEAVNQNIYDEYIWVDSVFELIGTTKIDLSGYITDVQLEEKLKTKLNTTDISEWAKASTKPIYTAKEVGALSENTPIPKNTSELINDSGFLTEHQDISTKADKSEIPTKMSQLINDSNYLNKHQDISGKLNKNQGAINSGKILGIDTQGNIIPVVKPSSDEINNYNNLINKPIINIMCGREPIILKDLAQGLYSIIGNYKYDYPTETFTFNSPTLLQVEEGQNLNEKIIHFEINKNQERYYKEIYFMSDGSFTEKTHVFNNIVSLDSTDLPITGEASKIYITSKGLFIWDNGQYKKLGAGPIWESF